MTRALCLVANSQVTIMVKAQIDSEANHPVFLPRLVPHVFNNRQKSQSHPKRKMSGLSPLRPSNRTPITTPCSLMSTVPGTRVHSTATSSTSATQTTHNAECHTTILKIRAIFDGDPDTAAKIFAESHRINPRAAASIIADLASGGKEDQKLMAHLFCYLFEIDPRAGYSLLLTLTRQR